MRSITKLTKKLRNQNLNEKIKSDEEKQQNFSFGSHYYCPGDTIDENALVVEEKRFHFSFMVQTTKRVENEEHGSTKSVSENKENIVHVEQYSPVDEISAELRLSEEIDNIALDSEEEKQTISAVPQRATGDKRKFSRSSVCPFRSGETSVMPLPPTYHCDSSSDEEMKELYTNYRCSNKKTSIIHTRLRGSRKIACVTPIDSSRPSLNFEKMQLTGKKLLKKSRPRIVKLKTLHSLKSRELNDLVTFKPINLLTAPVATVPNSKALVPVEEPIHNGFVF